MEKLNIKKINETSREESDTYRIKAVRDLSEAKV